MNYIILKNIIEATLAHFNCQNCQSKITDKDINVLGTAWNGINMEIICPNCKTSGVIKAEINVLPHLTGQTEFLNQLKKVIEDGNQKTNEPGILEADILALRQDLNKVASARDLFE